MSDSVTARAAAGVSFLFRAGERPDDAAWRAAVEACQARAQMVSANSAAGSAEVVLDGLTFDVDGLAPAPADILYNPPKSGLGGEADLVGLEAVRLYPGHHLSGGLGMVPVVRALIALAAETAMRLPARAVCWHAADTVVGPQGFAHSAWAWLAGGAFPARVLTALTVLADGSVASRGLAHFTGQEMTLRCKPDEGAEQALCLAERIVSHLVLHGRIAAITETEVAGETLCFEPAQRADHVWIWRKAG